MSEGIELLQSAGSGSPVADFQFEWAELPPPDIGSAESTITVGSNTALFGLFIVRAQFTPNALAFQVEGSAGNVDVGIYKNDGTSGLPGTKLASSGSTAAPGGFATGRVTFTGVALPAGQYWAAIAADNGTFQVHGMTCSRFQKSINTALKATQTTAFPLPSTAAATAATSSAAWNPPILIPARG